jgi:hypothetical protein
MMASCYQKALISSAATCALRLHQRWPQFQLNYQFLNLLVQEDSAHYLFFSVFFLLSAQLTLVLLPITLLAVINLLTFFITRLHSAGYQGNVSIDYISVRYNTHVGCFCFSTHQNTPSTIG